MSEMAGEVYDFYVERLEKYGACQILAVDGKSICYVLLDYLEEDLPGEDILEWLRPYHRESFRYHHQMIKMGIENTPVLQDYWYMVKCGLKSSPVLLMPKCRGIPVSLRSCFPQRLCCGHCGYKRQGWRTLTLGRPAWTIWSWI